MTHETISAQRLGGNVRTMTLERGPARKSPDAIQLRKRAFYSAAELDYRQVFEYMNDAFARLCSTEGAQSGVRVFFEKREPSWKEC